MGNLCKQEISITRDLMKMASDVRCSGGFKAVKRDSDDAWESIMCSINFIEDELRADRINKLIVELSEQLYNSDDLEYVKLEMQGFESSCTDKKVYEMIKRCKIAQNLADNAISKGLGGRSADRKLRFGAHPVSHGSQNSKDPIVASSHRHRIDKEIRSARDNKYKWLIEPQGILDQKHEISLDGDAQDIFETISGSLLSLSQNGLSVNMDVPIMSGIKGMFQSPNVKYCLILLFSYFGLEYVNNKNSGYKGILVTLFIILSSLFAGNYVKDLLTSLLNMFSADVDEVKPQGYTDNLVNLVLMLIYKTQFSSCKNENLVYEFF